MLFLAIFKADYFPIRLEKFGQEIYFNFKT